MALRHPVSSRHSRQRAKHQPRLEELEPRLMPATINVLGYHYDNANDGQYQVETTLTPKNVKMTLFGKLWTAQVDGQVYAEPLYKFSVNITRGPNQGLHNVVFVATEHDSLFAFDADNGGLLWKDSFINPAAGINPVPNSDVNGGVGPEVGITGTPVIDPVTNTIYLDAATKETGNATNRYVHRIWGVQISDGSSRYATAFVANTRVNGDGSFTYLAGPTVNGSGDGNVNGKLTFNAFRQMQRPGLTLVNGTVYVGYGSYFDGDPYHGWILGFNHSNPQNKLQMVAAFNTTPNGSRGAIWQGGGRISADAQGNLYVETGNGTFDSTLDPATQRPQNGDYGDTFLQLAVDPATNPTSQNQNGWGLKVADYFTPFNQQFLNDQDLDIGSTAPTLLPDSVGLPGHPLLFGGGKEGRVYLVDRSSMGGFNSTADQIPQEQLISGFSTWGTMGYFNNQLFVVGSGFQGQAFSIANATFSNTSVPLTPDSFGYPGSTPFISSNGNANGIVWNLDKGTGQLRAYDASNYANELWTSDQAANGRDTLGSIATYATPTVAHGKVYVGTFDGNLVAYGLLPGAAHTTAVSASTTASSTSHEGAALDAVFSTTQAPSTQVLAVAGSMGLERNWGSRSAQAPIDWNEFTSPSPGSATLRALIAMVHAHGVKGTGGWDQLMSSVPWSA